MIAQSINRRRTDREPGKILSYKNLLVLVDSSQWGTHRTIAAAELAARFGATLVGLHIISPVAGPRYAGGLTLGRVMREEAERARADALKAQRLFQDISQRFGISAEWRVVTGIPSEQAAMHARYADLTIIGPPDQHVLPSSFLLQPDEVIFGAGRPVIVVPREAAGDMIGRRILVAWRSSREAARAVNDALPLLATAEAVDLVVVNPTSEHDVRDYGEEPGASIAAHLARHGISVEVLRERAVGESVGKRLLACAAGRGADLIVLGAYGHSVCVSWFLAASHNTCSIMPHYRS
ncbi:universal stress protein [Pseudorhodoplanes sp.]|uniref:universal stress protein n=1 Tax=Pseudorhodoplanes sp. TaxID=1934341 RepID=UPI003D0EDBDB